MFRKKINGKLRITLVSASLVITSFISYSFVDAYFEVSKNLDIFSSVFREINMYYVDSVEPGKLMKKGIDEMLECLDPYTNFIPESDMEDYRYMTTGQYGGIGAMIRQKDDFIIISEPYEGFPAQKSGLMAGDLILEIDGKSVKGKRTDDISHILKGSPGTKVKLLIKREGSEKNLEKELTREEIKIKSVPWSGFVRNGIGYIRLNSFTENAGRDIGNALKQLKGDGTLNGVVLDLRGNPGGLLFEAVNVANVFISKGKSIVSTRGKVRESERNYKAINEAIDTDVPLVVLVNRGSASASEIVSGSIQDLDRGVIIGQRTFGKGLVQTTRPLPYNAQIKITTAKYYIPSGRCIQALDYSHRNDDGSVGKIPDSLVTSFTTSTGRIVYNGGGIQPDIVMPQEKFSNITSSLISKGIIFDFASEYVRKHPTLTSTEVELTEADFRDFQDFLSRKQYDYSTKSEKSLEEFAKNAEEEKYYSVLKNDIEQLKEKLTHDKQEDVLRNRKEIIELLEEEIASRYFYQVGRIRKSLAHDPELEKAIEVLKDKSLYKGILNGEIKIDASANELPEDQK